MLTRRNFIASAAVAAASRTVPGRAAKGMTADDKRPNILIFMPDQQQGATVLPGHPAIMPNVRQFAEQSTTFSRAFCPAPHCCPSRASFMTGLYPSEHGIFNNIANETAIHPNPYPGVKFFSSALKDAGYDLAYSGKWHVARDIQPQDCGWTNLYTDEGNTFPPSHDRKRAAIWEKTKIENQDPSQRVPGEVVRPDWGNLHLFKTTPAQGANGYEDTRDYKIVNAGNQGLKKLAAGDKPWCLMVSNDGGHDPYNAPKNFVDLYQPESIALPPNFPDMMDDKPRTYQRMRYQYFAQLSNSEVKRTIAHYWARLSMQDALFGTMLKTLEETGQAHNTIVIYISDHGDYAGAHGLWAKGVPSFDEAYNIPCIIRWPARTQVGRHVDALVSTTDLAPTILEAAGVTPQARMSGASLMPWINGQTPSDWRDAVCSQMNGVEVYYTQRIVRTRTHKYVYNCFDYDELYDLTSDPHEMVNLAFPDLSRRLAEVRHGVGLDRETVPWPSLPGPLEEVRRDLVQRIWKFAADHNDQIFNPYLTVAFAPFGPGLAF